MVEIMASLLFLTVVADGAGFHRELLTFWAWSRDRRRPMLYCVGGHAAVGIGRSAKRTRMTVRPAARRLHHPVSVLQPRRRR
jgi:hypothetical protein